MLGERLAMGQKKWADSELAKSIAKAEEMYSRWAMEYATMYNFKTALRRENRGVRR